MTLLQVLFGLYHTTHDASQEPVGAHLCGLHLGCACRIGNSGTLLRSEVLHASLISMRMLVY